MRWKLLLGLACVALLSSCGAARVGVVESERISTLNSADWNVKNAPAGAQPGAGEDRAGQP